MERDHNRGVYELVAETRRPVVAADLITVDDDIVDRLARQRPELC